MFSKKFSPERQFTNCLQGKALRLFLLLAFVLGQQAASFAQPRSLLSPMADKAKLSTVQPYGMGGTYYPMVNGLRYIFEYPYATVTNYYGGTKYTTDEYQGSITVPDKVTYSTQTYTVKSIGKWAFCFSYLMTDISLPNTIEKIDSMAFQQCYSLTSIEIPNSVKNLNYGAFYGCENLLTVNIPNSLTDIERFCFYGCSNLTSVDIPASVTRLEKSAFASCANLTAINVAADNEHYSSVDGLLCSKDTKTLLQVPGAMADSFAIPRHVTAVDSLAFNGCRKILSITIPKTVTHIAYDAIYDCDTLNSIIMQSATPPALDENIDFTDCSCPQLKTLYVPKGYAEAYNVAPWNTIPNIVEYEFRDPVMSELVDDVKELAATMPTEDFSSHGLLKDASQLSTNKQEPTEGPVANLLDGNRRTSFQSTFSVENTTGEYHYLQADLGYALSGIHIKYQRCNNSDEVEPKTVRVFATNDANGEWTEIGLVTFESNTGDTKISLGDSYRHIRLQVEETFSGLMENNNLFFGWSEFGIWNATVSITEDISSTLQTLLAKAQVELEAGEATEETIKELEAFKEFLTSGADVMELKEADKIYARTTDCFAPQIDYIRNYTHTDWQALYIPFDVAYDDICEEYDVAALNNFHQFDDDEDGTFDRTVLEVLKLKAGATIAANTPYVIRAKSVGEKTITVTNTYLKAVAENTLDCSSVRYLYTFHGTYNGVSGEEMFNNGYYAFADGTLCRAASAATSLGGYRWYVSVEDRTGSAPSLIALPAHIKIVVKEEEGGAETGINDINADSSDNEQIINVYDLNGRLVAKRTADLDSLPKGVYIVNGKKVIN